MIGFTYLASWRGRLVRDLFKSNNFSSNRFQRPIQTNYSKQTYFFYDLYLVDIRIKIGKAFIYKRRNLFTDGKSARTG